MMVSSNQCVNANFTIGDTISFASNCDIAVPAQFIEHKASVIDFKASSPIRKCIVQNNNKLSIEGENHISSIILQPRAEVQFTQSDIFYTFKNQGSGHSRNNNIVLEKSTLTLPTCSEISFSKNDNTYHLKNSNLGNIVIEDIFLFINTCKSLNDLFTNLDLFTNPKTIEIHLDEVECFRAYDNMDKELIGLFAKQNNMSFNPQKVDLFINQHFFELSGIAHNLTCLDLESAASFDSLPEKILQKICSYLKLSDVKLSVCTEYVDNHTTVLLGVEEYPRE